MTILATIHATLAGSGPRRGTRSATRVVGLLLMAPLLPLTLWAGATSALADDGGDPPWRWPVSPADVVTGFDPPADPYGSGHRGVDLAVRIGQPIRAPAAGRVAYAGQVGFFGVVVIEHGDVSSTFEPVKPIVVTGMRVDAGQAIGLARIWPGHCAVICLHWGVRRGDSYVNPLSFLSLARPRLLPYWSIPPPTGGAGDGATGATGEASRESGAGAAPAVFAGAAVEAPTSSGRAGPATRAVALTVSAAVGVSGAWLAVVLMRRRR